MPLLSPPVEQCHHVEPDWCGWVNAGAVNLSAVIDCGAWFVEVWEQ
jgi:hypothetical protein